MDLSIPRMEKLIDEHIFSERDRRILKRKWFDRITYEVLAEEEGMSVRWIKEIVKRSELILVNKI